MGGRLGETGRLGLAERGRPAEAARRRGSGEASARWFLRRQWMHGNRGRKAVSSVRPIHVERAGGALTRGGLRLPFDQGIAACPRRRDRRPLPGSLRDGELPYIRAGKSWRLVREDFSREGVGGQPEASPGSHPSSGGTGRRRPGRRRPRTPLSCIPAGRPRPPFVVVLAGGDGRGRESPGSSEDRGSPTQPPTLHIRRGASVGRPRELQSTSVFQPGTWISSKCRATLRKNSEIFFGDLDFF